MVWRGIISVAHTTTQRGVLVSPDLEALETVLEVCSNPSSQQMSSNEIIFVIRREPVLPREKVVFSPIQIVLELQEAGYDVGENWYHVCYF